MKLKVTDKRTGRSFTVVPKGTGTNPGNQRNLALKPSNVSHIAVNTQKSKKVTVKV